MCQCHSTFRTGGERMTEATYTYASATDLERSPEELKKYRISGYVPVYEPILTNDAKAILEFAMSSYVTDGVWLEDIQIGCCKIRGAKPDYRDTKNVRICIYGYDMDGGHDWLDSFVGWIGLDKLARVCEGRTEYSQIRLLVIDRHESAAEDTAKAVRFFIRRPLTHDSFLAMREGGEIKAWDT